MNDIDTDDHVLIRDDLEAFLDGELDPPRERIVRGHLAACETCRVELRSLEGLGRLLLSNRPAVEPSADFERAFSVAFQRESRGRQALARPAPVPESRAEGAFAWLLRPVLVPLAVATAAAAATILLRPDAAVEVATPIAPAAVENVVATVEEVPAVDVAETKPIDTSEMPAEPPPVIAETNRPKGSAVAIAETAEIVESAAAEASDSIAP